MARQFTALRVVGTIFKILAWIGLILGLLAAVGGLFFGFTLGDQVGIVGPDLGGPLAGIAVFVVSVVVAIVNFLLWYAAGEAVYVFLSIEENTRRSAYYIQQQFPAPEGSYQPPPPPEDYEQY